MRIKRSPCVILSTRETKDRSLLHSSFSFLAPFSHNSAQLFRPFFLSLSRSRALSIEKTRRRHVKVPFSSGGIMSMCWWLVCGGTGVLRAIDREMLEWFDDKHRRINVRHRLDRGRFDRRTRRSQSDMEHELFRWIQRFRCCRHTQNDLFIHQRRGMKSAILYRFPFLLTWLRRTYKDKTLRINY